MIQQMPRFTQRGRVEVVKTGEKTIQVYVATRRDIAEALREVCLDQKYG